MTRNEVIQVRVSPEEKEQIRRLAEQFGLKTSDWVRKRALHRFEDIDYVVGDGEAMAKAMGHVTTAQVAEQYTQACPYNAVQLSNMARIPRAAAQRHIDNGTWRELL